MQDLLPGPASAVPVSARPRHGWSPALEVSGLTKKFGDRVVVDNVSLAIPRGCAFGYLGPNGAGKTTLIRMVLGLTPATSGSMRVLGFSVPEQRGLALGKVGAIVDEPRFHGYLTGRQNLRLLAAAREPGAEGRIESSLERVGLRERAGDRVASYSMGMRQRLGVAACLLGDPELLILDEPMNGLDPAGMVEFRQLVRSFVAEGRTVILSSHLLDEVERTCDAVAVVDQGRVVVQGPIGEVIAAGGESLAIECDDTTRARQLLLVHGVAREVSVSPGKITARLHQQFQARPRDAVGEITRVLVENGITVYQIAVDRGSLEQRFLDITSTLGRAAS
jgi:ABC-type multidrug transport system ATPase subunit